MEPGEPEASYLRTPPSPLRSRCWEYNRPRMGEGHKHDHRHHAVPHGKRNPLGIVLALTVVYMLAEAVGGYLTNSLALISDAGHMLTDVAALLLAMLAL